MTIFCALVTAFCAFSAPVSVLPVCAAAQETVQNTEAAGPAAGNAPAENSQADGTQTEAAQTQTEEAETEAAQAEDAQPAGDEYVSFSKTAVLPEITAPGGILIDADSGIVLYGKNIHRPLYPASTTKVLTCLLAYEALNLENSVTFSHDDVFSVPRDASNIGIDENESLTVEQALTATMAASANECANALGAAVSGSLPAFAEYMNEKAAELGALNTHFVNANGLFDEAHYTTPYDLSLFARAYFRSSYLSMIANVRNYHIPPSEFQPDDIWILNHNQFINGERPMPGLIGGKTGYTEAARASLVTCVERNGLRLICVVMGAQSPNQYNDTETLIRFGYENFRRETLENQSLPESFTTDGKNAAGAGKDAAAGSGAEAAGNAPGETSAETDTEIFSFSGLPDYLRSGRVLMGSYAGKLEAENNVSVLLPSGVTEEDLVPEIRWNDPAGQNVRADDDGNIRREVAVVDYFCNEEKVGSGTLIYVTPASTLSDTAAAAPAAARYVFLPPILLFLFTGVCGLALLILLVSYIRSFYFGSSVLGRRLRRRP